MSRALCLLAILLMGGLSGMTSHRRATRLRLAYRARRLVDDRGILRNEVRWLRSRVRMLRNPRVLLPNAERHGVDARLRKRDPIQAPAPRRNAHGE